MIEASKDDPSPLDAYESAEPDEPIFTLQGGDPLAASLVQLWGVLARVRCGITFETEATVEILRSMLKDTPLPDEAERDELLMRATAADQISWAMNSYRKGLKPQAGGKSEAKPVSDRLDLHDYRIYCAQRISNAFSEFAEMLSQMDARGWADNPVLETLREEIVSLRLLYNELEPRPGMRIENVERW